jgi:urease accessory protein
MSHRVNLRRSAVAAMLLATLAPATAFAHPGHNAGEHLIAGVLHPLTGLDHVLMIVAVSAWAALLATKGRILVAGCLALFVGTGALLPVGGGPALEAAIAMTVIGAGMLLAVGRRWPLWATGALGALFALVHGFAHGAEGPANSFAYVAGLMLATAALALLVSFLAALLQSRPMWLRAAGLASAALGTGALAS